MKVSKREKIMLLVLVLILAGVAYYMFFVKKHRAEMEELQSNLELERERKSVMQMVLLQSKKLDLEIEEMEKEIKNLSKDKYASFVQENQTVLVRRLSRDTGLKIKSMTFEETSMTMDEVSPGYTQKKQEEAEKAAAEANAGVNVTSSTDAEPAGDGTDAASQEQAPPTEPEDSGPPKEVDSLSVVVDFDGTYEQVDAYLKKIAGYEKKIVVSNLSFNSQVEGKQDGTMTIRFFAIRDLEDMIKKTEENYFADNFVRVDPKTAYVPYPGYVILSEEGSEGGKSPFDESSPSSPSSPSGPISFPYPDPGKTTEGDTKRVRLDSFEKFDVFFVGNNSDVYGGVRLSSLANDMANSVRLNYDFFNPAVKNRASMVFDKNKKIIYENVSSVNFDLYASKSVGENKIGITVMDSSGKETDFYIDGSYKKEKWQKLSINLKTELKYPIMLKSVFVEGDGIYQSVKGDIHIDNMSYTTE